MHQFINGTILKKGSDTIWGQQTQDITNSPYAYTPPNYGAKEQFVEQDNAPSAAKDEQTHVQKVTGKFLWYA